MAEEIIGGVPVADTDDKYVTFKRSDALAVSEGFTTFRIEHELPDAVVIRRQDFFASPALATYAAMIAIAAKLSDDDYHKATLLQVADYFERQAQLAADEGHKFPDV